MDDRSIEISHSQDCNNLHNKLMIALTTNIKEAHDNNRQTSKVVETLHIEIERLNERVLQLEKKCACRRKYL